MTLAYPVNNQKDTKELINILETLKLKGANLTPAPTVEVIDSEIQGMFNRQQQLFKYDAISSKGKLITGSMY